MDNKLLEDSSLRVDKNVRWHIGYKLLETHLMKRRMNDRVPWSYNVDLHRPHNSQTVIADSVNKMEVSHNQNLDCNKDPDHRRTQQTQDYNILRSTNAGETRGLPEASNVEPRPPIIFSERCGTSTSDKKRKNYEYDVHMLILHNMIRKIKGVVISPKWFPEEAHQPDDLLRSDEEMRNVMRHIRSAQAHQNFRADLVEQLSRNV
ncbi:hypothetical protein Tco_1523706 [Tanacetum coccineum]